MAEKSIVDQIAMWLVIIGGLNWGLVGVGWNLVTFLFGWEPIIERIVYIVVGLSAIYMLYAMFAKKKK